MNNKLCIHCGITQSEHLEDGSCGGAWPLAYSTKNKFTPTNNEEQDKHTPCKHERFQVKGKVGRLHPDGEPDNITEWRLDVEVHCLGCMMPFLFVGLPGGYSPTYPTVSVEETKARLVIKPAL